PPISTLFPYTTLFRSRQRGARRGGRGERADHSLLGDLVEFAAPGTLGDAARQAHHGGVDAGAAADDAAGLHAVFRGGTAGAPARDRKSTRLNSSHLGI